MTATDSSDATPAPLGAVEIAPDLWQLPLPIHRHNLGGANAFLIRDTDGYLLFDCGADVAECSEALAAQLGSLGVPFDAIHTLVLSHGHGDHAGLANGFARRSGARIVLHERDATFVGYPNASEADRQQFVTWLRRQGYPDEEIAALVGVVDIGTRGDRRDEPILSDRLLTGGEVLPVGRYRFEVLWTPGHTPGHICLLDRQHGVLLCGDHILEIVTPNVGLHPLLEENPLPGYLASIQDLASQDLSAVLPGHGRPIPDLGALTHELEVRHESRRAQIRSLLTAGPQSPYEISTQVWAKPGRRTWSSLHPHLRRNAVGMVAAHLELMAAAEPEVKSREEDGVARYLVRG
jgi:glyoxylase-like metal-dependent hydrolase (beta-lactamase superfamily II)